MENHVLDSDLTVVKSASKRNYAGFWIRVWASLVDFLVFLPLVAVNFYNLYYLKSLPLVLFFSLASFLYKPLMEYKYGATLGKMALKIKVVNDEFENISLPQSLIRFSPWFVAQVISLIGSVILFQHPDFVNATDMSSMAALQATGPTTRLSFISSILILISGIVIGLSERKQGLHDKIASTYCIYK